MGKAKSNLTTVKVPANCGYYGFPKRENCKSDYINLYDNKGELDNKVQKNLANLRPSSFSIKNSDDTESRGYEKLSVMTFKERHYKNQEPRLVYEAVRRKTQEGADEYYLKTGLYIGYLNVNGIKIEINTGYNKNLINRMLMVANNFFLDNSRQKHQELKTENMLSSIVGYMFLTCFKAAYAMGLPSEYKTVNEQGFNVRGRIDVNKYIQRDMFIKDRFSYSYKQREYVQDIVDVLYLAMQTLEHSNEFNVTSDFGKYFRQLKQLYSGKRVSHETLQKIEKHRSLNNPMYSRYKNALLWARYVIELKDIIVDNDNGKEGLSGFLIDVSQLWEVYLENRLKKDLESYNYVIRSQEELYLYRGSFYHRYNYPDLVIEDPDGNAVAVIDAKFKTMNFQRDDVDRSDLFQIHSYAGYYNEKNKEAPLKFCSLVYPARKMPDDKTETDADLYGLDGAKTRFSVGYIEIGDDFEYKDIIKKEEIFLKKIKKLLGIDTGEEDR